MVNISGFTIVRNAIKLDFPVEASIRSILRICDEVVVNVGRSEDETLDLVRSIGDPKIRIVETEWDMTRGNTVLGIETHRAMRACTHPWGVYIQADEVLHEDGARELREAIERNDANARVEGLLVRYLHFFGGLDTIATNRRWYRYEVRAVRWPELSEADLARLRALPFAVRFRGRLIGVQQIQADEFPVLRTVSTATSSFPCAARSRPTRPAACGPRSRARSRALFRRPRSARRQESSPRGHRPPAGS